MNINDVVQEGSKYLKLDDGETLLVRFGKDFVKKESTFGDKVSIKYETDCFFRANGKEIKKTFAGSSRFFEECNKLAVNAGTTFETSMFRIRREGAGTNTKYFAEIVGEVGNA